MSGMVGVNGSSNSSSDEDGRLQPATALDVDGVAVVGLGTVLWTVALVVSLVFETDLRRDGHLWWIATAACGAGLGLLGIAYCVRRRRRLGTVASDTG